MSQNDAHPNEPHTLRSARSFITKNSQMADPALHVTGATTAVTLESADQAQMSISDHDRPGELAPIISSIPSVAGSFSPNLESVASSDSEDLEQENALHLPDLLNDLMRANRGNSQTFNPVFNPLTDGEEPFDEAFLAQKVLPDKSERHFKDKLKHFFILSAAGKPIYSLNGDDDVLLGYMGLITTITASFQEGMKKDLRSISSDSCRIVVKTNYPLLLVAISKIPHEVTPVSSDSSILENQLDCLYNYVSTVLSQAVINKTFEARMNYDLRRILTVQDFHALDTLAMKLTYGFHPVENLYVIDSSHYLSAVLDDALRCVRISNTCRTKLNEILLSVKKLKSKGKRDFVSSISNSLPASDDGELVAADLLFGFITMGDSVISHLRPRNHRLENRDISTLLSTLKMSLESLPKDENADLWIPLCMPHFNSSGFLYCYVKSFVVCEPLTVILVSGNKNSFFNMKEAAKHVFTKIQNNTQFKRRLGRELGQYTGKSSILGELKVTAIKHFVYKSKEFNQVFMEDAQTTEEADISRLQSSVQMISLYSNLIVSRGSQECTRKTRSKKLTYSRWNVGNTLITGFLLIDENYEFYCLCEGSVSSRTLISESLRITKWCERYKKRLFVRDGVSF